MNETPIQGLYAFWKYDQFPYIIGGEVSKINGKGHVYAPSYQSWFVPLKILPIIEGKELGIKIKELTEEYKREEIRLKDIYVDKLKKLVSFMS